MKDKKYIETCFSPKLLPLFNKDGRIVVVADIFRATSSICAAFDSGAKEIVPVSEKSDCLHYKAKGFIIAGERDGKILDYADIGNSPDNFTTSEIKGRSIALNTTNGTRTIKIAGESNAPVVIGAFVNLKALTKYLISTDKHILVFCSGYKDHFSLEDSLFAGLLANNILSEANDLFQTKCDATNAAIDLWKTAESNPREYINKASHRDRLQHLKLDNVIDYCMSMSITEVIPILTDNKLVKLTDIS